MKKSRILTLIFACAALLAGCSDEGGGTSDAGPDGDTDAGICGRPADAPRFDALPEVPRFAVVGTDFSSSFYAWLDADGEVVDADWINSGTTVPGLVATLSGDSATATVHPGDGTFYVIDRLGTDVITRVAIPEGVVLGQMRTHGESCDSAFTSNPYDLVIVSGTQGFVSRYSYDATGSASPECRGSDLLEFDPSTMTRTGNFVDLSSYGVDVQVRTMQGDLVTRHVEPRPASMLRLGNGLVAVALERLTTDFNGAASGVIVVFDPATRTILDDVEVTGLENCGGMRPVPGSPNHVALLCTGYKKNDAMDEAERDKRDGSGVVVLSVGTDGALTETAAWRAIENDEAPALAGALEMLDATRAIVVRRGDWQSTEVRDDVYLLDLATDAYELVVSAEKGYGIYGSLSYDPATRLLLIPDADVGVRRFRVSADLTSAEALTSIANLGPGSIPVTGTALVDIGPSACE